MSQQNQSSGNQQQGVNTQSPASSQQNPSPFPWSQILLAIIANFAYFKINTPDLLSVVFFNIVTLPGIGILTPPVSAINAINSWIGKAFQAVPNALKWLRAKVTSLPKRQRSQKSGTRKLLFLAYILVFIVLLFQNFFLDSLHTTSDFVCITSDLRLRCSSGESVSTLIAPDHTSVRIGLITDTNETETPFDWTGSSGADQEATVEHKILREQDTQNHACSGIHMTLAVVTMLSRTVSDPDLSANVGLEDLRGAYLAQKDYNSQHNQNNAKLCLVIANIGTLATAQEALPLVVKQLILFSKSDSSFRGITGFPFSAQVDQVLKALDDWRQQAIPIVSPSATSNDFSHEPNFYRIAAPDDMQSDMMAKFIKRYFVSASCSQVKPTIAVLYDKNQPDPYSTSLASAFINAIRSNGVCANTISEPYVIGDNNMIETNVQDAIVNKGATMIFFAGYANDIDAVEYGIQLAQQQQKSSALKIPIPIFAGDGVDDLTRYIDNTYSIVYSTIYAPPLNNQNDFVREYYQAFPQSLPSSKAVELNAYTLLPPHAILSYDAVRAFLQAFENTKNKDDQQDFDRHLATVEFTGVNNENIVFQGNNSSNPSNKSVYILCADHTHALQVAAASDSSYPPLGDVQQCSK